MTAPKDIVNPLDLLSQLGWTESDDLEFKSAQGGLPRSLWETYSAMANTQGGVILLGVENDGTVVGLSDTNKIKKHLWDTIHNPTKVSINLLQSSDVQEVTHAHRKIIAIRVPRATRHERPIFIDQNPLRGTFRRNHDGDYHCSQQEVQRMFVDQSDENADHRILNRFRLEDLDTQTLQQYRRRLGSLKPSHPWLNEDDLGFLTKLGGWRRCRKTGIQGPTVAGLLMFGREETLREALPQYHVDYREKLSDDPAIRWTDRLTLDGTWAGNLFQFYFRVVQRLSEDLKLPFELDAHLIRKGETVVHEAIREALVNALIHADYLGQGGIIIEKYKDRFEFSNPGLLLISLDQLLTGNISECRNKSLQTMFTMIGTAEKAGSGVDKIHRGWRSQHWRSPIIREQVQPDRVVWTLPMISLIPQESLARLTQKFGTKFQKLSPLEVQALVTADIEKRVDNARMRQMTSEHPTDLTKILQKLVSKELLIQDGQGRWTSYRLPPSLLSIHNDGNSIHNDGNSIHNDGNSIHNDGNSIHKDTLKELRNIATVARTQQRLNPREIEKILLKLCQNHWLTTQQLAKLLARNGVSLRSRFLTRMVEQGQLRLRYPEKPNHINQAYTSKLAQDENLKHEKDAPLEEDVKRHRACYLED